MQQLIQELSSGTTEYKDDTVIQHPPNSVMLRAARTLQQIIPVLENNQQLIQQLQIQQNNHLQEIEQLRNELSTYRNSSNANTESLRQSEPEVSAVGGSNGEHSGSDPDSQGRGTDQNTNSSTN
jgi:hypothetical protein